MLHSFTVGLCQSRVSWYIDSNAVLLTNKSTNQGSGPQPARIFCKDHVAINVIDAGGVNR